MLNVAGAGYWYAMYHAQSRLKLKIFNNPGEPRYTIFRLVDKGDFSIKNRFFTVFLLLFSWLA
jgi:hypothetical protein